eukprot:gene21843-28270_t
MQDKAFEVLKSLPSMDIQPTVEHYARTHDYKQTKATLRLMGQPRVKLDSVTYGYLINCFADSKKPRSALSAFHQMRKQNIEPSMHTYMGVLKALAHMRDGLSAMHEVNIKPDKRHYAMAMFACVVSNQCALAESLMALYLRQGFPPDVALCSLWLRALLQQGRWGEALETLRTILDQNAYLQKRSGRDGSLQGSINALSFALGVYSSQVTRMYREDFSSQQLLMNNDPEDVTVDLYPDQDPDLVVENRAEQPNLASESNDVLISQVSQAPDGFLSPEKEGEVKTPTKNSSGSSIFFGRSLSKPSVEGLRFLVSAVELITSYDKIILPSEFYIELLKSLILEGQPNQAGILLKLREG